MSLPSIYPKQRVYPSKREQLDRRAAAMRSRNLTRGKGCKSIARAIAARLEAKEAA